jgi:hypothetical protein
MAVAELADNMLKYADGAGAFAGSISIVTGVSTTTIVAESHVESPEEAGSLVEVVEAIGRSDDAAELYRERIASLLSTPEVARSRLGLVRIAHEGRFRLRAARVGGILHVTAERSCDRD